LTRWRFLLFTVTVALLPQFDRLCKTKQ